MSRHDLTARDTESHTVTVGWDAPMETYFAQVASSRIAEAVARNAEGEDEGEDDDDLDPVIFWIGTCHGEVPTLAALVEQLAPYAEIPQETQLLLAANRLANIGFADEEEKRTRIALAWAETVEPDPALRLAVLESWKPYPRDICAGDAVSRHLENRLRAT